MTVPRVSVFMPVYNGEKYLKESIESVLNQTYANFELIILNDGSSDRSQTMIASYRDPRIRLLENPVSQGLQIVRNQGLQNTQCEYIAPIDCDDVWLPQRLRKQVEFLDANPRFSLVGSRAALIDEHSRIKGFTWRYGFSPQKIPPFLLFGNYFIHSSILMRRSLIPQEGYQTTTAEDYDLWVRMSKNSPVWSLPDVLVKYRVHNQGDTYRQAILSDRTQQQVRKIYLSQLHRLGIQPLQKDLDLHYAIGNRKLSSLEDLSNSARWLSTLLSANQRSSVYDQKLFLQIIIERWLINCLSATGILTMLKTYFSIDIPKKHLLTVPLQYLLSFLRYLRNKDLGKIQ